MLLLQVFDKLDANKNGIISTKLLKKNRLEDGLEDFYLHGDETEKEEDVEQLSYILSLLVGDEEAIEDDSSLLPTERDAELDQLRERSQLAQSLLGSYASVEDDEDAEEEDEEEEDDDAELREDPAYKKHLAKIRQERLAEKFEFDPEGLKKHLEEEERKAKDDDSKDNGLLEKESTHDEL